MTTTRGVGVIELCELTVSSGELGSFVTRNASDKQRSLRRDGIQVKKGGVDLARHLFTGFQGPQPLVELTELQTVLSQQLKLQWPAKRNEPELIAGVDVSYQGDSGTAALCLFEVSTKTVVDSISVTDCVSFPYISSYLAFREIPLLIQVFMAAKRKRMRMDACVVDGNGILHPRNMGIATMMGSIFQVPTIGIAKTLALGSFDESDLHFERPQPIQHRGQVLGMAMIPNRTTSKPIYVSPGNLIDPFTAQQVVSKCLGSHRLPEPIYWADKFSRDVANSQSTGKQ